MSARPDDSDPADERGSDSGAGAEPGSDFESVWEAIAHQSTMLLDALAEEDTIGGLVTPGIPIAQLSRTRPLPERDPGETGPAAVPLEHLPRLVVGANASDSELHVLGELGRGGMGEVALAVQRSLRREVAVKTVRREVDDPGSAREALLREALFTGYLQHPNIVPVHVLGRDAADRPVLVMKRIEGGSWRDLIADPEHPTWPALAPDGDRLRRHLETLIAVCNAVHFAHSRRVIHRDIKPANVMIGDFGEVYLLDWGLALRLDDDAPASTDVVGTPAYMAPEMLRGDGALTLRTDVYLLGATLHHAVTGRARHQGTSMRGVMASAFLSAPFDYGPDVPDELAALCNRATHQDPAQRFESALAVRRAVEAFLQHRASVELSDRAARRLTALETTLAGEAEAPAAEVSTPERVAALAAECRFGFEQARREWDANPAATDGLQRCLELQIEHELAQRHAGLVATLIEALPRPRPDLAERLAGLRAELDEASRSRETLRRIEQDRDPSVAARPRAIFTIAIGVALGAIGLTFGALDRRGIVVTSYEGALVVLGVSAAVLGSAMFAARRWLMASALNRTVAATVIIVALTTALNRVAHWVNGYPFNASLIGDALVFTTAIAMLGAVIDRRIFIAAPMPGIAVLVATYLPPGYAADIEALAAFVGFTTVGWIWFDRSRRSRS